MRRVWIGQPGAVSILLLAACVPRAQIAFDFDEGQGGLQGRVTDVETGEGIPAVALQVHWGYHAYTDRTGRYAVTGIRPGAYTVELGHPWFHPDSARVEIVEGSSERNISLRRASTPCCDLLGEWTIELTLDSLGGQDLRPTLREISGRIWFAPHLPHPMPRLLTRHHTPGATDEVGRFEIDFTPFWGGQLAPTLSTSRLGGGPDLLTEVLGVVYARDSTAISLIPGLSHGGIALYGQIAGDTIMGQWWQKAPSQWTPKLHTVGS